MAWTEVRIPPKTGKTITKVWNVKVSKDVIIEYYSRSKDENIYIYHSVNKAILDWPVVKVVSLVINMEL